MLRIILTTLALTASGPALANQLEASLGLTPGVYTTSQLAELYFADGDRTTPRVHFESDGRIVISMQNVEAVAARNSDEAAQPVIRN